MPCPFQALWFFEPKNVWTEVIIMKPAMVTESWFTSDVAGMKHVRTCNQKLFTDLNSSKHLQYKCWWSMENLHVSKIGAGGEGRGGVSVSFLEEQWEDRLSPVLVNTLMAFASVIIAFMTTSSEKQDLHIALTCSVFGIATWWGHWNKILEKKGWKWRLSIFPLSAYCHISGHADLVFINHPKARVVRKVYHEVNYSCEMDGWTTPKK
jgi:hypothetical protein